MVGPKKYDEARSKQFEGGDWPPLHMSTRNISQFHVIISRKVAHLT